MASFIHPLEEHLKEFPEVDESLRYKYWLDRISEDWELVLNPLKENQ